MEGERHLMDVQTFTKSVPLAGLAQETRGLTHDLMRCLKCRCLRMETRCVYFTRTHRLLLLLSPSSFLAAHAI